MIREHRLFHTLRRSTFVLAGGALCISFLAVSPGGASTSSRSTDQKIAAAKVVAAEKTPTFKANSSIDMSKLKGKVVTILTSTNAVPFVFSIAQGVQQAASLAGWKSTIVNGQGSVTQWSQVVMQAVSQKVDGIITVGASPAEFKPAVAAAKAAGIPVVDVLTADQQRDPLVRGDFAHVSISFYDSGELQADYVIANGAANAHILILGDNEFPGEVTRVQGMQHEFKTLCPNCKVTVHDNQVANLGTTLQSTTETLLRADSKIKWVLPTYDAQGLYVIAGIKAAGLASSVEVVGSDAVASNLALVKTGAVQVADVGEPSIQSGWAGVDMMARAMLGKPAVQPNIPLRMFVKSNLIGENVNNSGSLFGNTFIGQYKKIWGLH